MFGLTSYDGKLDIAYFYADTIAELANLPNLTANGKGNLYTINAVGVGSKCDCYEDKNVYILKGDNTWQIFKPIESSGGGGSSYTLPTASTTTLGGVKIDGTSVTINDGVISASGGVSYVAGNGIDITNNTISADVQSVSVATSGTASSSATSKQTISVNGTAYEINGTKYMEQSVTLSTSATTAVTFTNADITTNSVIEYACSQWGIVPDDITVSTGSCIVTMPKVDTAVTVNVRIYLR